VPSSSDEHDDDADERAQARAEQPELRATPEMSLAFHARVKRQLKTQASDGGHEARRLQPRRPAAVR